MSSKRIVAALLVLVFVGLAGGGWLFYTQEHRLKQQAEDDLATIARFKIEQIENWRRERLGDATTASESPFFIHGVKRFLQDAGADDARHLLQRFENLKAYYRYTTIVLIGPDKQIRLACRENVALGPELLAALDLARTTGKPVFTDVHPLPGGGAVHLDVIAPLFEGDARTSPFLGWLALQTSASQFLYPLLQTWPIHRRTAETLLIRRDGDNVVFLNELRHQQGAPLTVRISLGDTAVLAVKAVLGARGLVRGVDYRNADVLGVVLPVPGTPWLMVAKMDSDEVYAAWRQQALYILALMGCLLAGGVVVALLLRQHGLKAHYRALYEAEAKLRDSLELQAVTLGSIGDAVIATDVCGRVTLINAAAERLTGWPGPEAMDRPLAEVFHIINEQTREPLDNPLAEVLATGRPVELAAQTLLVARDASECPIADSAAPIRDGRGAFVGMVLIFRDNSAERQVRLAKDALSRSEAQYRELVENAQSIILKVDTEGRITFFNEYAQQFFGYTEAEILGRPVVGTIVPQQGTEIPDMSGLIREILTQPETHTLIENENVRRDNSRVWVRWANRSIRDAGGCVVGLLSVGTDITDRRQAEAALRESEAFSRTIIENSPDCIKMLGRQGELLFMSQGGLRLLELSDFAEVAGKPYLDFWQGPDFERARAAYEEARQGRVGRFEGYCPTRSGTQKWWEVSISPVPGPEGEANSYLVVSRDDTQRKRLETLREDMDRIARHDLKTPLNAILGLPQLLLLDERLTAEQQQQLHDIQDSGYKMLGLVNLSLDLFRMERGTYELVPQHVDLLAVVGKALADLEQMRRAKALAVRITLDGSSVTEQDTCPVRAEELLCYSLFSNLLKNAQEASPPGGAVTVDLAKDQADWRIDIRNQGEVPAALRDRFFDKYATMGKVGGTGLGTYSAQLMAATMGGRIALDTAQLGATTVSVWLPADDCCPALTPCAAGH